MSLSVADNVLRCVRKFGAVPAASASHSGPRWKSNSRPEPAAKPVESEKVAIVQEREAA